MVHCHIVGCEDYAADGCACRSCKSSLGFALENAETCAIPLELQIQIGFKVVVTVLASAIVLAVVFKCVIRRAFQRNRKEPKLLPVKTAELERLTEAVDGEAHAMSSNIKDLTMEAIQYGLEHAKYCRIMDWTDPDAGVDAAYKAIADGGYRANIAKEEREVPREYPLSINVHTKFLMGVGVPLFFNFHALPLAASVLLLAATLSASHYSGLHAVRLAIQQEVGRHGARESEVPVALKAELAVAVERQAFAFMCGISAVYVCLLVLSLLHSALQWRFAKMFNQYNSTMMDYTALLHELPPELVSEKRLQALCREHFGCEPVGVSIGLDCRQPGLEGQGTVGDMMWGMTERLIIDYDTHFDPSEMKELNEDLTAGYDPKLALRDDKEAFVEDRERFRALVDQKKLRGSGIAAVVFQSKADCEKALQKQGAFTIDGVTVKVARTQAEPTGVEWFNVGTTESHMRKNEIRGAIIMLAVLGIVCSVVYYPLTSIISFPYSVEKAAPQALTSQCIGIINGIVGGILGPILFIVAGSVGYNFKARFDKWCLKFCMVTNLINFGFGNFCVLYRYLKSGLMAVDVLDAHLPAVRAELRLANFYVNLLVPGNLFTGWIVGKVMGDIWPFVQHFLVTYLVFVIKCLPDKLNNVIAAFIPYNPRVFAKDGVTRVPLSAREAEYIWVPKIFSVAWEYPEKIWNPAISFLALFALGDRQWVLFLMLLLWLVVVYMYHRFVQFHAYAKYMNSLLEIEFVAQQFWAAAVAILAAAAAYWASRLGHFGDRASTWKWACPAAYAAAFLVHQLGLHLIYARSARVNPRMQEAEEPYRTMARRLQYSWFNCNPAYVLKSHFAPELLADGRKGKMAPFLYGKEYLVLLDCGRP